MVPSIHVGKNVVRIIDREFPIDSDLFFKKHNHDACTWKVGSAHKDILFHPIKDGEVSTETFRTYHQALHQSMAFNTRGKMRQLFDRKEQGVKIIPGHGVFILPSKMQVVMSGARKVSIRTFSGTSFAKTFHYSTYEHMVQAAADHYHQHVLEVTAEINESLYLPVSHFRPEKELEGLDIPTGITVCRETYPDKGYKVGYYSIVNKKGLRFASNKELKDLPSVILDAENQLHKERIAMAEQRRVIPRYIPLSQYMRGI